jgi:hypothetical protein
MNRRRWVLPGFDTVLFAAQMNLIAVRTTQFMSDPGTGWHLRLGALMLDERAWIRTDPFSFVHAGEPWVTFEWLSEIFFALVERAAGLGGVVLAGFALFGLLPLLLLRWLLVNGIPRGAAFTYSIAAVVVFQAHALARPHVFTYLAFGVLLLLVGPRIGGPPARRAWCSVPVLFAVWANLHGGFLAGLAWLAAAVLGATVDGNLERRAVVRWAALIVTAAASTLVNPHGLALYGHIGRILGGLETERLWMEFAPPDFYGPSLLGAVVLGIVFLLLVGLARRDHEALPWEQLAPLSLFLFFAFKSQRHVMLLVFVAGVPVCRAVLGMLPCATARSEWWRRFAAIERQSRGDLVLIPLVALAFGMWLQASGRAATMRVGEKHVSAAAIAFLADHLDEVRRPITTTTTGGPLVYYLFPRLRDSFDDRSEFGDAINLEFLQLFQMRPGWRHTLAERDFDSAILPVDMPLAQGLALLPDWREAYRDPVVVVFLRSAEDRR